MKDTDLVRICLLPPRWHYHKPDCPFAWHPGYITMTYAKMRTYKTSMGGKYKPCDCIYGRYPKLPTEVSK